MATISLVTLRSPLINCFLDLVLTENTVICGSDPEIYTMEKEAAKEADAGRYFMQPRQIPGQSLLLFQKTLMY